MTQDPWPSPRPDASAGPAAPAFVPSIWPPIGPAVKPPRPRTVNQAVGFMIAGLVLSTLTTVALVVAIASFDSHIARFFATAEGLTYGVVGDGLWIWMIFACRAGHNWARIVGTTFFGIGCFYWLSLVGSFAFPVPIQLLGFLTFIVSLAAVVLLWRRPSGEYFNPPRVLVYPVIPSPGQPVAGQADPYVTRIPEG